MSMKHTFPTCLLLLLLLLLLQAKRATSTLHPKEGCKTLLAPPPQ